MSKMRLSRLRQMIFGFYMSGIMSLLMSGVITFINTGIDGEFHYRWGPAFLVAWAVAFPLVTFIAPLAGKMTEFTMRRFD
ncbi:hypothetical protein A6779_10885 [Marinobacter adhaerens]|uniref:DUF2798 domain-containing protein n=1 Tax=Marinobacter salsuginis TaxID=418719 RepID=A0A5M3PQJ9_9GAMM|nr:MULTISPECIES: DUF2798 domain-containing protein [Marinobacter]ODM30262.1 hypothetical protein A6779_10885 [Marinobacter adhaerens]GBO85154.1 hypothetical protein MS5N3_26050 [Marinobacter salsuginis]